MRKPFNGEYPMTRGFIGFDPNMPKNLWDPIYGPTHRGVDWALPEGTRLYAAMKGQVTAAGFSPDGAGNLVVIKNGNAYVKYFHMKGPITAVRVNQYVEEGDYIGESGKSGNATGAHLHFQLEKPFGTAIDPLPLLTTKGEVMDREDVIGLYWTALHRRYDKGEVSDAEINGLVGLKPSKALDRIRGSKEWLTGNDYWLNGDARLKKIDELTKSPDARLERARQIIRQAEEALL